MLTQNEYLLVKIGEEASELLDELLKERPRITNIYKEFTDLIAVSWMWNGGPLEGTWDLKAMSHTQYFRQRSPVQSLLTVCKWANKSLVFGQVDTDPNDKNHLKNFHMLQQALITASFMTAKFLTGQFGPYYRVDLEGIKAKQEKVCKWSKRSVKHGCLSEPFEFNPGWCSMPQTVC